MFRDAPETEKLKKTAGVLLVVLGLSGLFLGYFYIKKNINLSTLPKKPENAGKLADSALNLRFQDTDKDGINDYDELYFYNTSAYLEDTDSDGINDKEEIAAGEDPTCPKGQSCFDASPLGLPSAESPGMKTTLPEAPPEELTKNPFENLTAEKVREMLKNAGLKDELLQGISDEELKKMMEETMGEIQASQ